MLAVLSEDFGSKKYAVVGGFHISGLI